MFSLYILSTALAWKTSTFKWDNHRYEFPDHLPQTQFFSHFHCNLLPGPDPGGWWCECKASFQQPRLLYFCEMNWKQSEDRRPHSAPRMAGHSECSWWHVVHHRSWWCSHPLKQWWGVRMRGKGQGANGHGMAFQHVQQFSSCNIKNIDDSFIAPLGRYFPPGLSAILKMNFPKFIPKNISFSHFPHQKCSLFPHAFL